MKKVLFISCRKTTLRIYESIALREDINWSVKLVLYTGRLWYANEIPPLHFDSVTNVTKYFTNDIHSEVFFCKHREHQ